MAKVFLRTFLLCLLCSYLIPGSPAEATVLDGEPPPIVQAAKEGNLITVRALLAKGTDINTRDNWNRTLLIIAAQRNDLDMMHLLVTHGADVNAANKNGITALIAATQRDNCDAIHMLAQAGAQVNQADSMGWTPLMWAVRRNSMEAVHLLLTHGADVSLTNRHGLTALHLAEKLNASSDIQRLLRHASPQYQPFRLESSANQASQLNTVPFRPYLAASRLIRGNPDAAITIVEYTDFQCPYCTLGKEAIDEILAKYDGKVRLAVKHLPLDSHPAALPAALYFEALARRNPQKAWQFYDLVFAEQYLLREGEAGLRRIIDRLGLSDQERRQLEADRRSGEIIAAVEADLLEAQSFGFDGVPVFIVNDVLIEGYYPAETFSQVIDKILQGK